MKKIGLKKIGIVLICFLCLSTGAFAQESNLNEDFSGFIQESQAFFNKMPPISLENLLTKERIGSMRKMGKALYQQTVLEPSIINIQGPGGDIALTIFRPDTINGVVLSIHGGGWALGSPKEVAKFNDELARKAKVAVIVVDYRLAPEHPFPACIEDCKAAAKWMVENSKKEFGSEKFFVSGDSAGGNLAALTTIYMRDSLNVIDKVKGVNLVFGVYDLGKTPSHRMATDSTTLSRGTMKGFWNLVFADWTQEQLQKPEYSPLYANLTHLPPALFTVGSADPLADDTYFMERRWWAAGNKTFLAVYPGAVHGFVVFPLKMSEMANERMYGWVRKLAGEAK